MVSAAAIAAAAARRSSPERQCAQATDRTAKTDRTDRTALTNRQDRSKLSPDPLDSPNPRSSKRSIICNPGPNCLPMQQRVLKFYTHPVIAWGVAVIIVVNFLINIVEKEIDPIPSKYPGTWAVCAGSANVPARSPLPYAPVPVSAFLCPPPRPHLRPSASRHPTLVHAPFHSPRPLIRQHLSRAAPCDATGVHPCLRSPDTHPDSCQSSAL